MKKLVIICEALGGGVRRHIIDLLRNLDKKKLKIYFIYNLDRADKIMLQEINNLIEEKEIELIEVSGFNRNISIKDISAFYKVYNHLRIIKPDIVHCHSSKAGVLGRIAAKLLNVKQIYYTPHAYYFQSPGVSGLKKIIYIKIEKFLSKFATTKTINVSKGERDLAIEYLGDTNKNIVIYNGIEKNFELNDDDIKKIKHRYCINDEYIISNVARVDEQKNPKKFIEIAKEISEKYESCKFIYAGDGELLEECRKLVKNYKLQDRILFIGFCENTYELMKISDICLSTSRYEGLPYSLIETCQAGVPIVATNVTGNNEIIEHLKNGFLFEQDNIKEAVEIILNLINNKYKMNGLKQSSLKIFNDRFRLDNMIEEYQNLYLKN